MQGHKNFWDKNAGRYDRFMRKDRAAYDEMYALIRPVVKAKTVLELATGTGLIAKHIVNAAAHIEATDASPEMIAEAKRDKELHKEYILCSYLAKLLPSDKTQPFDLDNRVKLEYYRLEKTYEGAIELEATPGSWKPTQPKRAGGQKDRLSPLDEIIARINEEFFGDFTDADRVMVDTLYTKMRQDAKVKKAAKSNDRQVYERSIFPGIFDTTAQQAYMENTEAYEQLFLDAEKYRIIQQALAERLYRELHGDSK